KGGGRASTRSWSSSARPGRCGVHRFGSRLLTSCPTTTAITAAWPSAPWSWSAEDETMKIASRMAWIGTESAFDVLVKARALEATGRDVIHLEIGEPDFYTPRHVVEAAGDALEAGYTHYGPAL